MIESLNRTYFPLQGDNLKMLDIGAALGHNSITFHEHGYDVTAIEIDPVLVDRFKANPASKGIDIRLGDATKLPYPDNTFDRAILIEVIEHVTNTPELLREINRVLKPGGVLCIGVPTAYTERVFWRLNPAYAANATHVKIFSRKELYRETALANFRIKAFETQNFIPAVSWSFHALLRSKSDHTGKIYDHLFIDRFLDPVFAAWQRTPGLRRGYSFLAARWGKSWYLYCEKIDLPRL